MNTNSISTIIFDRDGIVNDVIVRGDVISSPRTFEEFKIRQEYSDFYRAVRGRLNHTFIASNQPDVARSLLSLETHNQINGLLMNHFDFTEITYCLHDDFDDCHCRKPKPGLISSMLEKYDILRDETLIIGDGYKDILAGKSAGIRTVYYRQGYNLNIRCEPDYVVDSLGEILDLPIFTTINDIYRIIPPASSQAN